MAEETPVKKKAAPGWYPHPKKDGFERLWDGEAWTDDIRLARNAPQGMTAGGMIGMGIFIAVLAGVLGGALFAGDDSVRPFGIVVLAVGGGISQIVLLIGIIAKGVEIGLRSRD